ncbi:SusD/RagB family nutrient-binding outer membrane lipoprotein [Niastella sp. OAS944]|uniref:SusD/RagB family nutrient-binding outer membrane lipoprotein n=1 Tax=Niastella sp. OAS944 TaxID=2664089 RepID=UPI00347929AA|nr:cellobiose-specific phosphotransferase system component IIB [Chitinophagaceae bacterium OAS944]
MKKLIIAIPLFIIAAGTLVTGCKKSDFEENYLKPDASVTATIPSLYSALFFNEWVLPRYRLLFTFQIPAMGLYSQTAGYSQGEKVYAQATNYTKDRWDYFYNNTMARYREIEKYYNKLSTDGEKTGYQLFLETSRIFVYDQAAQMVDLWGDIPFSTAGQLNTTGNIILPSYDKAADVYTFILTDLKRISDYLASTKFADFYLNQLGTYDYVNKGSVTQWRKYCNSLILRLAMRISYKDETTAKALVQTILNNPTQYPLIDAASESIKIQPKDKTSALTAVNDMREGFKVIPYAPGKMVEEIMAPAVDPRLPIYFNANKNNEYHGVLNTWNASRVSDSISKNYYASWDSTTFTENNLFPGIVFTAAEVSFLKAEAYERWSGGNAKAAYEAGVKQSIQFYIGINNNSDYGGTKETMPTDAAINAYLLKPQVAYGTNNLEKIATQKWIDFGVILANQAWAEYRRTKLPQMTFPDDASAPSSIKPPTRLTYPTSEVNLNAKNYEAVKAGDNASTKIFWDVK